jgi:hypothetical protein
MHHNPAGHAAGGSAEVAYALQITDHAPLLKCGGELLPSRLKQGI